MNETPVASFGLWLVDRPSSISRPIRHLPQQLFRLFRPSGNRIQAFFLLSTTLLATLSLDAALGNKLMPCASLSSCALEVCRFQLRSRRRPLGYAQPYRRACSRRRLRIRVHLPSSRRSVSIRSYVHLSTCDSCPEVRGRSEPCSRRIL